jgi:hypothetical protein
MILWHTQHMARSTFHDPNQPMEVMMEEALQDKTNVRIYTDQYIIEGDIGMFSGIRMTDYINSAHEFVAVTSACVLNLEEKVLFRAGFLNVHKNRIVIIVPEAEVRPA